MCSCVLLSCISSMCSGAGLVGSGVGRASGMCVAGRLLEVALPADAFIRVA